MPGNKAETKEAQVKDGELLSDTIVRICYHDRIMALDNKDGYPRDFVKVIDVLLSQLAIAREALGRISNEADKAFATPRDNTQRCGNIAKEALESLSLDNPMPVSLKKCAEAIWSADDKEKPEYYTRLAMACLDAAGVKYVD